MRQVVALLLVIGYAASPAIAFQARDNAAAGSSRIRACALLPKELIARVTTVNKQILDVVKPMEEPLGARGSACHYGGITLQIDPFTPARLDELYKERGNKWSPTPGIGDAAYFFDNSGEYAELYARTGAHVFTIQMHVPDGGTTAKIMPNVITLAKEIVTTLR